MRSKPQIDSAMELFKFVLGFAGGKDGKHLIGTDEFVRSHGHPSRVFLANKIASHSLLLLLCRYIIYIYIYIYVGKVC